MLTFYSYYMLLRLADPGMPQEKRRVNSIKSRSAWQQHHLDGKVD